MHTSINQYLKKFKKEKQVDDLHITRMFGAFVAVSQGKVIDVDNNTLHYCPLASMLYDEFGGKELDDDAVKNAISKSIESKIQKFGHFTERREIKRKDIAVPYGASEMLMYALHKQASDCVVTVCDGAGTVVSDSPQVIQGIGARMNGLFLTSPIKEVINKLKKHGAIVAFPKTAEINQLKGVKMAADYGYKNIAVTVNGYSDANLEEIRKIETRLGVSVTMLTICTTGITRKRAKYLARQTDLMWSCASKEIREISRDAFLQITSAIPVFVFTQKGLNFVSAYCSRRNAISDMDVTKKYFISVSQKGERLKIGKLFTYLSEVEKLPIPSGRAPF